MDNVLITGFESFADNTENPSESLALALDGEHLREGTLVQGLVLPVDFEHCFEELARELEGIIAQHGEAPKAIVCLGLSQKAKIFQLEKVAINFQYAKISDNAGHSPRGNKIRPTGPDAYFSNVPVEKWVEQLNAEPIEKNEDPCYGLSLSAGSFVCNTLYYHLLDYLQQSSERFSQTQALFCHVPSIQGDFQAFPQTSEGQKTLVRNLLNKLITS